MDYVELDLKVIDFESADCIDMAEVRGRVVLSLFAKVEVEL
jgi:hypothetical protein